MLSFFLDAAGSAEWGVEQTLRTTTREGDATILDQLEAVASRRRREEPGLRVGVGESWTLGRPALRHIAVLVAVDDDG